MLKNSPMGNLTPHRNQTIDLQCTSIDWFRPNLSLHHKGLLNSPECKHQILYITHKYDFKGIHLHKLDSYQRKMYKKHAEVTINLRYLTHKELQFSKPFSGTLLFSWDLNHLFCQSV